MAVLTRFAQAARELVTPPSELVAVEERAAALKAGTTPIGQAGDRERCRLSGVIRSVVVGAPGRGQGFEIDLYDGSGAARVVWLGQREIAGLTAGRHVIVEGLVSVGRDERRTVLNPHYQLVPLLGTT